VSPPLWLLAALPAALAWGLADQGTPTLMAAFALCVALYHVLYQRLARMARVSPMEDTAPAPLASSIEQPSPTGASGQQA